MSNVNLSNIVNGAQITLKKHGPEILTGIGIAGMITTTALAVKATPKALMLIEEKKLDLDTDELKPIDVVKTVWPCYIPAAISGTVSIACVVGANSVNARRNAALVTAYTLADSSLKEYREKVVETLGEKKDKAVRDAVAKEKIEKDPVERKEVIITETGNTLCYDALSGRYFKSDVDKIRKAVNEINRRLTFNSYVSLNDLYSEIGLDPTGLGDSLGWSIDTGLIDLDFSSQLTAKDEPCVVLDFMRAPVYDYDRFL